MKDPIDTHDQLFFIATFSLMRNNYNSIISQISNDKIFQKIDKINQKLLKITAKCLKHNEPNQDVINFYADTA
jgi:uncharacterized protein YaaR (DUF327 family)